jgi:phosphoribosylamine--glycine ligase
MKVLLLDPVGAFTDFAIRLINAGHEVKQWQKKLPDGSQSKVGRGIVTRVLNWQAFMKWADIIILSDNAYQMQFLEKYHKEGYPIVGSSLDTSYLELRRGYGQDILEKAGLDVIPGQEFTNYNDAITYVKANPKRYVSKPSGDADKALSYVSKNPADMLFMLERWKSMGKTKMPFIMQEFVPGIEVAVGAWMGKDGFSKLRCENFEFKKLMPGNFGVNTGEMGTVLKYTENSALFNETLGKLEEYLKFQNYIGYVDLAFIIDEKGSPRPLEWTTRPGWPLFNIQAALHKGDPLKWMCDLLEGKDSLKASDKVSVGHVIAVPDFPFTKSTGRDPSGFPIYGLENVWDDIHLCEVMMGKGPVYEDGKFGEEDMFVTAGDYALVTSGIGDTVCEAAKKSMEVVKQIEIPSAMIVRDDVGERLKDELPKLQKLGYCKDFKYE